MEVLIANDQPVTLAALTSLLRNRGYETIAVRNGTAAWEVLQREDAPSLVLLDNNMPGMTGTQLCKAVRTTYPERPIHIIIASAEAFAVQDKIAGLVAGADDYIVFPFANAELLARLRVGERIISLQMELRKKIAELETTSRQVHQLQGLLPICTDCKRVRDDMNYWRQVENYMAHYADGSLTRSICPVCAEKRSRNERHALCAAGASAVSLSRG